METINQSLTTQGIHMAQEVSADATHIQTDPKTKEAAYNGHYKIHCHLIHHLISTKTGLTLKGIFMTKKSQAK